MKPAAFEYHRAGSLDEAAKALAGGHSLVPMLALRLARFGHLVELTPVDLLEAVGR